MRNWRKRAMSLMNVLALSPTPTTDGSMRKRRGRLAVEPLEPRLVLSAADSTVVFNEIMYHPLADADLEWIELYNQMAVDMDLSGWRLDGGVDFDFPAGTVLPGGGYLVVAAAPDSLPVQAGFDRALGPYTGRLSNGGEEIVLRDNSDRLMDAMQYDDEEPWPVAADGSGASLAKREPVSISEPPENWTFSAEVGGTPGQANFPTSLVPLGARTVLSIDAPWKYEPSGGNLGTAWRELGYNDAAWPSARASLPTVAITEIGTRADFVEIQNVSAEAVDTSGWVVAINDSTGREPDINKTLSTLWPLPGSMVSGEVLHRHDDPEVDPNDPTYHDDYWGAVIPWKTRGPGWVVIVNEQGTVVDFAVWGYSPEELASLSVNVNGFDVTADGLWGGDSILPLQSSSSDETFQRTGDLDRDTAADWTLAPTGMGQPNDALTIPFTSPGIEPEPGPITYYFRTEFQFGDAPSLTELVLDTALDDGAVFYLNGQEIYRQNMPEGEITHSTLAATAVDTASFVRDIRVPAEGLIFGTNVLAVEVHQATVDDPDVLFGSRLGTVLWPAAWRWQNLKLSFNEITAPGTSPFFVELTNNGEIPVQLEGYLIVNSAGSQYVLPRQSLAPGDFLAVNETDLMMDAHTGDKLYLFTPDRGVVLDGMELETTLRGRFPDGTGRWLYPDVSTPGRVNHFDFHDEIVINEIMYHHRPDFEPYAEIGEEWIELYNRSDRKVDLSGWRLDDAVEFALPAGTLLAADEYLVVADNAAALLLKWPGVNVLGDFSGGLSNSDERIVLLDAAGNPADEVHYYDDAPWTRGADGNGSSLELIHPDVDNTVAEAWAASDEAAQSMWRNYSYTMTAVDPVFDPADTKDFPELRVGLLSDGEVLLDNISVVEKPGTAEVRELIQNGTFGAVTPTADKWRLLGNHSHSTAVDDGGETVLHLVATGPTNYLSNRTETTLKNGGSYVFVRPGTEYRISFDAKWLTGSPQLRTELYYNKVTSTTILAMPPTHGTPGARNSTFTANPGPTYRGLTQSSAVPAAGEDVTVSVAAADPDGLGTMILWYSVGGGTWQETPMTAGGDGRYAGTIPGQTAARVVQFYVEGQDASGATSTYPAAGAGSRALIQFADGRSASDMYNFRIIMTAPDSALLHNSLNILSNDRLGATLVYDGEIFYDAGVRLRGSMFSRSSAGTTGFNVKLPADQLFRGVHSTVTIKRRNNKEILVKHMALAAGGIPNFYDDIVQLISHRTDNGGPARLSFSRYDDVYFDSQFDNGSDGTMYKMEGIRVITQTSDGTLEGIKQPRSGIGWINTYDLTDLGDDKEQYRWTTLINNNRDRDDYAPYIALAKAFDLTGAALVAAVDRVIDVDEWMRVYALASLAGIGDMYTQGNPHNHNMYVRPDDGKIVAMPWDWDFTFNRSTSSALWGNKNLGRIIAVPVFKRLFLGHMMDLIDTSYNTAYMTPWMTHYGQLTGESYSGFLTYMQNRTNYVLGQIPMQIPQVSFAITTNGGNDFSVDSDFVTMQGTGWINVREIHLAGSDDPLQVTWLNENSWHVTLPIGPGVNDLMFEAYNFEGKRVDHEGNPMGSDSITVTSTITTRPYVESLRISEINYNPTDPSPQELARGYTAGDFEYIELQNVGEQSLDLSGVRFTEGVTYEFVGRAELIPGQRVVLAKRPDAFTARYGPGVEPVGPFELNLSNGGERITLVDPVGAEIASFRYGDSDDSGWPDRADGRGASLELIDPTAVPQDATLRTIYLETPGNWRSSSEYGGSPGAVGAAPRRDVLINEVLTHTDPPAVDSIELYNATGAPLEVGDWYLSDSNNYKKFRIPETTIEPHGYVAFDEDDFNSLEPEPGDVPFALDGARGDDVWLLEADPNGNLLRFVDHVEFPGAANGESFGRWPDGVGDLYPMIRPTLDPAGENSGPRVGPVVITEVHYNPAGVLGADDLEFVEIYNSHATETADLTDWRIRKGIDFDFPAGTLLEPQAALVIVPFDLNVAAKSATFCNYYGIDGSNVQIVGGYSGVLDNGGERVQLQRPDEPPADAPGYVPRLLEDEVRYYAAAPWPDGPDGTGRSLNRLSTRAWGNDPENWIAAEPSPGTVLASSESQVVDYYVFYNNSEGFGGAENAVAPDKVALRPGRIAGFANYTSYDRGLNGVMIDIAGLPGGATLRQSDFEFHVGNSDDLDVWPDAWPEAPPPTSIAVVPGGGFAGSARVTLVWDDGEIQNQWLQVTVLDTAKTGLPSPDVFYFGNAIGESGDSTGHAKVNTADVLLTRNNPRNFLNPSPLDFRYDYNRDRRVNATDMLIARSNQTHVLDALKLITAPGGAAKGEEPASRATSSDKMDWLYEWELADMLKRPAKKDDSANEAVEEFFLAY